MRAIISSAGVLILMFCSLCAIPAAHAQGVGDSGSLRGTITDPSNALIPKGAVTATDNTHGGEAHRLCGRQRPISLQRCPRHPRYQHSDTRIPIRRRKGFRHHRRAGGQSRFSSAGRHNLFGGGSLRRATIVETERGSQANTITPVYIEDLQIDRRDYLNFTLLLPGVSDSTRLADDQDFRVKQTPQSGLSSLWQQWPWQQRRHGRRQ